nr:hypothetical protein Iba_chr05dCG15910 [Ipomoea batatas]
MDGPVVCHRRKKFPASQFWSSGKSLMSFVIVVGLAEKHVRAAGGALIWLPPAGLSNDAKRRAEYCFPLMNSNPAGRQELKTKEKDKEAGRLTS